MFFKYAQDTCLAINHDGCEFEYNSIYMEDGSEEEKKLKVYLHVRDGEKEKCPDVGHKYHIIFKKNIVNNTKHFEFHLFYCKTVFLFQVYTMEITLGIFAFLLLLGIITVLLFLGLYRLNDARAYAK